MGSCVKHLTESSQYQTMVISTLWIFFLCNHLSFLDGSELTVKEAGTIYNQSVALDVETSEVVTHVPGHVRDGILFRETIKLDNNHLGVSLWRELDGELCYLRDMMQFEHPEELSQIVDRVEADHKVVDSGEMLQVQLWAKPNGQVKDEERELLSKDMKMLCQGLPIIRMRTEQLNQEEFQKKVDEAGDCYQWTGQNGRKKRQATTGTGTATGTGTGTVPGTGTGTGTSGTGPGTGTVPGTGTGTAGTGPGTGTGTVPGAATGLGPAITNFNNALTQLGTALGQPLGQLPTLNTAMTNLLNSMIHNPLTCTTIAGRWGYGRSQGGANSQLVHLIIGHKEIGCE